jgi:hypothetical protein
MDALTEAKRGRSSVSVWLRRAIQQMTRAKLLGQLAQREPCGESCGRVHTL